MVYLEDQGLPYHGQLPGLEANDHPQYLLRADFVSYSGTLQAQIDTNASGIAANAAAIASISGSYITEEEMTTISGDIITYVDNQITTVNNTIVTTSGDIITYVDNEITTVNNTIITTSGDILTYVSDNYIDNTEMTTISGDLQTQIDDNTLLITTVSGDLQTQITYYSDHGNLLGLLDDDHTQYLLADGSRELTANWDFGSYTISGSVIQPNMIDLPEISTPANPDTDKIRIYAVEDAGFTVLETITDLGIINRINQDTFRVARNTSGATISGGRAVYFTGSTGNKPNFSMARANAEATMPAIGMTTADVANNSFGEVMIIGRLTGLKTDYAGWTEGDVLYVDPDTPGSLTKTRPTHPNLAQWIATIEVVHANNGVILVKTQAMLGIEDGTNRNTYTIGDTSSGTKSLSMNGTNDSSLQWDSDNSTWSFSSGDLLGYISDAEMTTISGDLQTQIDDNTTLITTVSGDLQTQITLYSDHGNLLGLLDDDHTQYILADGTRAFSSTVSGVTPTEDAHLVTKLYVDNAVGTIYEGTDAIVSGSNSVTVSFGGSFSDTSYVLNYTIKNTDDATPAQYATVTSDTTVSGFTVDLSGPADTGNYYLEWRASDNDTAGTHGDGTVGDSSLSVDHTYYAMTIDIITAAVSGSVVFGEVLYIADDFVYASADADTASTAPVYVMAISNGSGNQTLLRRGDVRDDSWSWSGGKIYLSTTAGTMTQTRPTGTADQVVICGYATATNKMFFDPNLMQITLA